MNQQPFNLPYNKLKIRLINDKYEVFDVLRKKYVILSPEEEVRQQFLHFLIKYKSYPEGLLAVEYSLKVNQLKRRADLVAFDKFGHPLLIVECKAPRVKMTQKVFDQIAHYNMSLKVDYLIVTNGLQHFCCQLNHEKNNYIFLNEIPDYHQIMS